MKRVTARIRPVEAALTALLLSAALVTACGQPKMAAPAPPSMSGFLDDYSRLRPGGEDELRWVYRNPEVDWSRYDAILLEPVTLWRTGKQSLAGIPEQDLQRLVNLFERELLERLGRGFRLTDEPGPGVMRVRLGITEAAADDRVLDVLTARADDSPPAAGPLHADTRAFIARGAIEGEIRDAETDVLLAQGVDRRPEGVEPAATWGEVEGRVRRWVDRLVGRLETRTSR